MAFQKKIWQARQGEGLNKFSINGADAVTLVNKPDQVNVPGDAFSDDNMNNLELRIDECFKGKSFSYTESSWKGASAPYTISLLNSVHGLGNTVKVNYFDDGASDFEWRKDTNGNITIYSNVKVSMKVQLN